VGKIKNSALEKNHRSGGTYIFAKEVGAITMVG
jgi:hypothetical protein